MTPSKSPSGTNGKGAGVELLSGVVTVVEDVQRAVSPRVLRAVSSMAYDGVRAGIVAGGGVVEVGARLVGVASPVAAVAESAVVQRAVGVANGLFGEYADSRGEAVPAAMTVRLDHQQIELDRGSLATAYPSASGRVVVFLHGLVETERSWFSRSEPGTDFGSRLTEDLAATAVYVRYNTGRHVADNGRELVGLLDELVAAWPVPVTEIVLIGHSMGGLVARSAVRQADGTPWSAKVTRLVCLGTPHTGAPLERGVAWMASALGKVAVLAPLVRLVALRSDGIKDLASGSLQHDQNAGAETVLPAGVRQYFVAATLSRREGSLWSRLVGDLLVGPSSAGDPSQSADVEWLGGLHHFDLLHHDTVYDALLGWLRSPGRPRG